MNRENNQTKLQTAQIGANARLQAAQISAAARRSSGGKAGNKWVNTIQDKGRYAYQSIGEEGSPGTAYTDPDDHNVEDYRQALISFKHSGEADDDDIAWIDNELENLKNKYQKNYEVYAGS